MSHVVVIIQRSAPSSTAIASAEPECTYRYEMPVPHDANPAQVGELVRKAYKRLEGNGDE